MLSLSSSFRYFRRTIRCGSSTISTQYRSSHSHNDHPRRTANSNFFSWKSSLNKSPANPTVLKDAIDSPQFQENNLQSNSKERDNSPNTRNISTTPTPTTTTTTTTTTTAIDPSTSEQDQQTNSTPTKRRVYLPKLTFQTSAEQEQQQQQQQRQVSASQSNTSSSSFSQNEGVDSVNREFSNKFRFPVGDKRDNRVAGTGTHAMELTFLGTASCIPSITRGVNCIALRYGGDAYLFDCGEATQIQIQRSKLKLSRITKIFITHLHGDHSFGLPGLLCFLGSALVQDSFLSVGEQLPIIDIYGPEGIRNYLRASLQLTFSRIAAPHRIHEFKQIPYLHQRYQKFSPIPERDIFTRANASYGERPGGLDLYPNADGIYQIPPTSDDEELIVQAAPMQHSVPSVGFVVMEKERPGGLRIDVVEKLVVSQQKELLAKYPELQGQYRKFYGYLKTLQLNQTFTFPNGVTVKGEDIIDRPKIPKKIVIMGDTCDGSAIKSIAMNATTLVHEATNAFIPEFDMPRFKNFYELEKHSYLHGHSTPQMAGRFGKAINAKQIILTHFSSRYRGDSSPESMQLMWRIENMARSVYPALSNPNDVIAAWDLMTIPIFGNATMGGNGNTNNSDGFTGISSSNASAVEMVSTEVISATTETPKVIDTNRESVFFDEEPASPFLNATSSVAEILIGDAQNTTVPLKAKRGRKKKVAVEVAVAELSS